MQEMLQRLPTWQPQRNLLTVPFLKAMVLSDDSDIDDLIDGDNATRERGAYCVLPPACATLVRGSVRCCCAACRWC
jgi:hypothetical protein